VNGSINSVYNGDDVAAAELVGWCAYAEIRNRECDNQEFPAIAVAIVRGKPSPGTHLYGRSETVHMSLAAIIHQRVVVRYVIEH